MKAEVLSRFSMPWLTCIGLFLFMAVFFGALVWVYRRGSSDFYAKLSTAPLAEPEVPEFKEVSQS